MNIGHRTVIFDKFSILHDCLLANRIDCYNYTPYRASLINATNTTLAMNFPVRGVDFFTSSNYETEQGA